MLRKDPNKKGYIFHILLSFYFKIKYNQSKKNIRKVYKSKKLKQNNLKAANFFWIHFFFLIKRRSVI